MIEWPFRMMESICLAEDIVGMILIIIWPGVIRLHCGDRVTLDLDWPMR